VPQHRQEFILSPICLLELMKWRFIAIDIAITLKAQHTRHRRSLFPFTRRSKVGRGFWHCCTVSFLVEGSVSQSRPLLTIRK
jgi:hypothetical protein